MNQPIKTQTSVISIQEQTYLFLAIGFFCAAAYGAGWSMLGGWSTLYYVPTTAAGALVVLVTSIVILVRRVPLQAKVVMIPVLITFAVSGFFVVGDNLLSEGYHHLSTSYYVDPPIWSKWAMVFYLITGVSSLIMMIASASWPKPKRSLL